MTGPASHQQQALDHDGTTASPVILGEYGRGLSEPITHDIGCLSHPNRAVSGTECPSIIPIVVAIGIGVGIKVSSRRHRVTLVMCLLIEFNRPWPQQNRQRCS